MTTPACPAGPDRFFQAKSPRCLSLAWGLLVLACRYAVLGRAFTTDWASWGEMGWTEGMSTEGMSTTEPVGTTTE